MLTKLIHSQLLKLCGESDLYTPVFFRPAHGEDSTALESLLSEKPYIKVYDTMPAQLKELVKSFHPSITLTDAQINEQRTAHLRGVAMVDYGVWVYYPWNEKLVHLLDEDEFILLRTNRNKYKITDEEETVLATKRVGVIGLSVGQSVSLTMAMERTFGELRIADFDDLEITNLNRLRSGVHNMGLLKTVLVAREISEIDPFLKVTCFHEGITEDNLEEFLMANGKLDVLIDECDGVDVKIKCRIAARKHGIPVLMEASDRATIDIERFDLEPDRPILHGFVEHLDISNVKGLKTMEEKLPYILPIVGIETMSPRLKASAIEVGNSISTWPQLASAVTLGGGITADICRKMLLGQLHVSGRFFIDIDELISDPRTEQETNNYNVSSPAREEMEAAARVLPVVPHENSFMEMGIATRLVDAALQAPSAGNNQPWKWYNDGQRLLLFDDPVRSAAFANYDNMITLMSMGTALENMYLKGSEMGVGVQVDLITDRENTHQTPVAAVTLTKVENVTRDELVEFINVRHTNRRVGSGENIAPSIIEEMRTEAMKRNISSIRFLESRGDIERIAAIAGKAEKLRMFIPQGHSDLFDREIRWGKESAERTRDGLDIRTLDLKAKDEVGFRVIKDPRAIALVSGWGLGVALENMTRDLVASASAVCLISGNEFNSTNCIEAGRALERAWLVATKHRISVQPVMASVFHFARLIHGAGNGMPDQIKKEFHQLYTEFIDLFTLSSTAEEPLFLFRLCYAEEPQVKSLRLDIKDVYYS